MKVGLALPHFDYCVPWESPVQWTTVADFAVRAEAGGFDSVWLADHLFLEPTRWGGPEGRYDGFDPLVGLGALARATERVHIGALVLCAPLRPAAVLAKSLSTLDRLSGGRLVAGLGAGWGEAEFAAAGLEFGRAGVRVTQLEDTIVAIRERLGDRTPTIWVGGRGDRVMQIAARHADGFNFGGWSAEARRPLSDLRVACERAGRDPATLEVSVNHTVTDVAQLSDELGEFGSAGVATVILGLGQLPFSVSAPDVLERVASALP